MWDKRVEHPRLSFANLLIAESGCYKRGMYLRMKRKRLTSYVWLKRPAIVASCLCVTLMLVSCYSTTVSVGEMQPTDPAVEANTAHNGHFLGGLINATTVEDDVYVGDNKNYLTKTYVSVGDAIVTYLSCGLFAPTTTKFYLPYGSEMPPKVKMPPIRFGVRGGLNFSSPSSVNDNSLESQTGIKLGVILDVPMTSSVYFQPSLYYSQKGVNIGGQKQSQDYFEIPLLISYRFGVPNILASATNGNTFTKDLQLQVHFGPYFATDPSDNDYWPNRYDAGLQFGVGGLFLNRFYVGISYDYGLTNLSKTDYKYSRPDAYNRNFSIVGGINF